MTERYKLELRWPDFDNIDDDEINVQIKKYISQIVDDFRKDEYVAIKEHFKLFKKVKL